MVLVEARGFEPLFEDHATGRDLTAYPAKVGPHPGTWAIQSESTRAGY
jgi:hypothetical protein